MRLPAELLAAIEQELAAFPAAELSAAAAHITDRYRQARPSTPALTTAVQHAAYLAVRMPATYAACRTTMERLREHAAEYAPASLLDLGAGPGTSLWAAAEVFPSLASATLIDRDPDWAQIGKRLVASRSSSACPAVEWRVAKLEQAVTGGGADLVTMTFALGELPRAAQDEALRAAWGVTRKYLVIIEPGTPSSFVGILAARELLLGAEAHLVAPCPHAARCPMGGTADWCHFAARVERSAHHRRLKGARLGHEDEKFSYLIFGREPVRATGSRIVRHPRIHGGHIQLDLCTRDGLQQVIATRSQKEDFRRARRCEWGDDWPHIH